MIENNKSNLNIEEPKELTDEEPKELTDEEKKELYIQKLKDSKKTYHPKKQFGVNYKSIRKQKNKQQKNSRKTNR